MSRMLIRQFGRTRLFAIVITALPLIALPLAGTLWLLQSDLFLYWLLSLLLCGGTGYLLHLYLVKREGLSQREATTDANPHWPADASSPWQAVEQLASQVTPKDWPLNDGQRLLQLGRSTLEMVARHYHPKRENPLWELTVPHGLLIIERASRDMRLQIAEQIPFSHQLTVGGFNRAQQWKELIEDWENAYRVGRALIDPSSVLFRELRREMGNRIVGYGAERIQLWLLQEYVRKVGYYAIELYSGNLLLSSEDPTDTPTAETRKAHKQSDDAEAAVSTEPLRIMVLGRASAGKSSLINALFGKLTAATDVLPDTTSQIIPYRLEREGDTEALIFDTPGADTPLLKQKALKEAILNADLLLWVSPAHRPDRQAERESLDQIREWIEARPQHHPPPILAVATHLDLLRPPREWAPPYALANPQNRKAENIQAAVVAMAEDLQLPVEKVVPVCLAEGRVYNV
ncbi:MAG: GTPase, partial [Ketobacteraceae bacterium]|nr:GTPase [Ketobacteraceae bacterium]